MVLGAQWGDEGKGKLVDVHAAEADVCARCAGGNNAGHTIVAPIGPENIKKTFAFHLLPSGTSIYSFKSSICVLTKSSGLVNPKCIGLIGNGVVVHVPSFFDELDALQEQGTPSNAGFIVMSYLIVLLSDRLGLHRPSVCVRPRTPCLRFSSNRRWAQRSRAWRL